jgi:4-amino-4-deoxychorismate lyase
MAAKSDVSESVQVTTLVRYERDLLKSHNPPVAIADRFKTMSDFYLLAFHQEKIVNAVKHLNWAPELIATYSGDSGLHILFAKLLLHIHEDSTVPGPLQIRLGLAADRTLHLSSTRALTAGALYPVDLSAKQADAPVTAFGGVYLRTPVRVLLKDDDRPISERSRYSNSPSKSFENPSPREERLIVSKYGDILQGIFTTPYFLRPGGWVTPALSNGAPDGVTRRYALEHGLCKEGTVKKSDLKDGDSIWLSDGVRGFFTGKICLSAHSAIPPLPTNHIAPCGTTGQCRIAGRFTQGEQT